MFRSRTLLVKQPELKHGMRTAVSRPAATHPPSAPLPLFAFPVEISGRRFSLCGEIAAKTCSLGGVFVWRSRVVREENIYIRQGNGNPRIDSTLSWKPFKAGEYDTQQLLILLGLACYCFLCGRPTARRVDMAYRVHRLICFSLAFMKI